MIRFEIKLYTIATFKVVLIYSLAYPTSALLFSGEV